MLFIYFRILKLKLGSVIGATWLHAIWIHQKHMYGDFRTLFLENISSNHALKIQHQSRFKTELDCPCCFYINLVSSGLLNSKRCLSCRLVQSVRVETLQLLELPVAGLRDSISNLESAVVATWISQRKEVTLMMVK